MTRNVLGSGLRVLAEPLSATGVLSIVLSLEAGSRYDVDETAGLSSLTAGLMVEGTVREAGSELAIRVDYAGAVLDVSLDYETCEIAVTGLSERVEECVGVLKDVVRLPRLRHQELERARRKQLAEIAEDEDDPFTIARREFFDLVYGTHPRHRPISGGRESVSRLGLADVRAFRDAFYVPGTAVIAAAGDIDAGAFVDLVDRAFGDWMARSPALPAPALPRCVGGRTRFVRRDRKQTHIMIGGLGVSRSDPAYHAVCVMDAILGDSAGFGSRLGRRLRESEGLAYVIESDAAGTSGLDPGVVWIYTATSPRSAPRALSILREELERMRHRPPSLEELAGARACLVGRRLRASESCEERACRIVGIERYGLGTDYDDRYAELLGAVNPEDVQEAAALLLDRERHSTVVVGPECPWGDA